MSLARSFLRQLGEGARDDAGDVAAAPPAAEVEALLERAVEAGKGAWPDFEVPAEELAARLGERLRGESDVLGALKTLHATDFYLACGCVRREPRAVEAFERHFLSEVSSYLGRKDSMRGFDDEVKQAVRTRLLVSEDGVLPKIANYSGRGPLGGWLRMTVARVAVDLRKAAGRDQVEQSVSMLLDKAEQDPELAFLKGHYRAELEEALREALVALPARDASLLRLYFFEGLSTDALAAIFQSSVRSVQRWLLEARQTVLEETQRALKSRLGLPTSQIDSVMGLVQSQLGLDLDLGELLDRKT